MDATPVKCLNLYIFNETRPAAVFGVGTYIRELIAALQHSPINVNLVNLWSEKHQIQIEKKEGIRYWYFPAPVQWTATSSEQWGLYYRNIVYILQLHIKDKEKLIFHLNYMECKPLVDALKSVFDCKTVLVVHYLRSVMTLLGNISRLRRIISQPYEPTDAEEISAKISFQEEKEILQAVDKIVCLSNHTFDMLYQDCQIEKEKMVVISNGLSDVANIPPNVQLLRKKWHLFSNEKIILSVGRLDKAKGLSYLIKAFREVIENFPDCRLMIAGSGKYDTFLHESQDICTKLTFTGLLEKKDLYELYQIADIGVIPSFSEQCSLVAIEMMMHGLPMITTTAPGLAEMTENGISSIQVAVIEYDEKVEIDAPLLADKILYLLENPDEAKRLGKNARKRYEEIYSREAFRNNMVDFYTRLFNDES